MSGIVTMTVTENPSLGIAVTDGKENVIATGTASMIVAVNAIRRAQAAQILRPCGIEKTQSLHRRQTRRPLILQYGTNDRSKVPFYHRFLAGGILGSPGFLAIHRDGAKEQFSIRNHRDGSGSGSAFRDKALVAAASRALPKRIRPNTSDPPSATSLSEDFIPLLPSSRKRKRSDDYGHLSIYPRASPSSRASSSSPSRSPSPPPDYEDEEPSTAKQRSIALSRTVKANPSDTAAWLELISIQEALFPSGSGGRARTADEAKALAQLKLALYEEALPHVGSAADRERLLIGMMKEGARVWDAKALGRKLEEVTKAEAGSFALWKEKLGFEMTGSGGLGLTVEEGRGLMERKLKDLERELREVAARGGEEDKAELLSGRVVYLLLRLTCFLRDTGFVELAVAAWQAVLEMSFCRPVTAGDDIDLALESFADFWESEVARMGEEDAKGWRQFVEAMDDPPEAKTESPGDLPPARDPFKAWAAVEQQRTRKAQMPARTLDQGTDDDPFRVVMFSDIKEFLVWFPSGVLPLAKPKLVDSFLVFCGLPAAGLAGEGFAVLLGDPFVAGRGSALDTGLGREDIGPAADLSTRVPEFRQQGGAMAISQELLFGNTWFRYLDKLSNGDSRFDCSWVLGTLRSLVKACGVEGLAEYYLAMEWLNEPAGARKVAKGLLKQYSDNIRLYNAYALVESANHNPEVSYKVLSSATSLPPQSARSNQLLWNTWAWIHLEAGQKQMALFRLCASVEEGFEGPQVSPALLLKARSQFSSTRDYSLSSVQLETAVQHAESLALLEYLVAEEGTESASGMQGNITAAMGSIHSFSRELESRNLVKSPHNERLLQTAARLLYYHASHGPYRPNYVREQLLNFVKCFPSNTIFLEMFAWSQSTLRIDDPVRELLQAMSLVEPRDCLSTRRFAIRHEAQAGTAHSTRTAFEAAIDSDGCRGSVELWVHYIRFCCAAKELRGKAKDVFYRAIAACPWPKELYMEAFGTLVGQMSSSELRAVFNTMATKGLRIHVDLEEFIEGWKRRGEA
ncbi:Protein NRDE2 [Madurella mycetomatis]|uniref:Protein NRDE2 n=1 Tax=Madurella mycetomatis TaxID=100816 RepID=A0A175VT21_9PEZI|nr:Protein NRDE2 [Madurella mycetomatis]